MLVDPDRARTSPQTKLFEDLSENRSHAADGRNLLYEDIPAWEDDVFGYLDQHVKN